MTWLVMATVLSFVTLLTTVALLVVGGLRSAAHRHCVLLSALLCILAAPVFVAAAAWSGVSWRVPILAGAGATFGDSRSKSTSPDARRRNPAATPMLVQAGSPEDMQPATSAPSGIGPRKESTDAINETGPAWRAEYAAQAVWGIGSTVLLLGVVRSAIKARRILKSAQRIARGDVHGVIQDVTNQLHAKQVFRVGTCGKISGPVVVGFFRPWILLPPTCLKALSPFDLFQVLLHEGAHALRRDPLVALLQQFGGALLWWHPLVHLLNYRLTQAREDICDNHVLAHVEPSVYGALLLRLSTMSPLARSSVPGIGMMHARGRLEQRIRGLLDSRRATMTHVHRTTTASISCLFVLLSLGVASAQFGDGTTESHQEFILTETKAAPESESVSFSWMTPVRPNPLLEEVDLSQFQLVLTFHGATDKPFYDLTLAASPVSFQQSQFRMLAPIDEAQAGKIVDFLKNYELLRNAEDAGTQEDPTTGPQYLLRVWTGKKHLRQSLDWNLGTSMRLQALRKALDGDAASAMDRLLERLQGQMNRWESGSAERSLSTVLSLKVKDGQVRSGDIVPIRLELTNTGSETQSYHQHEFLRTGTVFSVFDERGEKLPYLGGGVGVMQSTATIGGGATMPLAEGDLSSYYYLRRPGRYAATFQNAELPGSNAVFFQVIPRQAGDGDGDPMGKLLGLPASGWSIIGSPNRQAEIQPGKNRAKSSGWQFTFVDREKGFKGSACLVQFWLTEQPVAMAEPIDNDPLPATEDLGKVGRWHAYFYASPEALERWPGVKSDLIAALEERLPPANVIDSNAATDDDLRLLHDRFKTLILAAVRQGDEEEIARLTSEFNSLLGAKLCYAQVVRRAAALPEPKILLSRFYGDMHIDIGKPHFERSTAPHILPLPEQRCVLIASNEVAPDLWKDDLQITLAIKDDVAISAATEEMRKLLPFVPEGWWLEESAERSMSIRPGDNWNEVKGRSLRFVRQPPLHQGEGLIMLWLAEAPAAPRQTSEFSSIPGSKHLGKLGRWHAYLLVSEPALVAWPTAEKDLVKALSQAAE